MKKLGLLTLFVVFTATSLQAAVIFRLNFDGPPAEDQAIYEPGAGDIIPTGAVISTTAFAGWGGGWATNPLNAPSIVSQWSGIQGGNALSIMQRSDNYEGYNVTLGAGNGTTNSLTIEILVKVDEVYTPSRNEYGMMTFIGNEAGAGAPKWSLRTLGQFGTPIGAVQLMTEPSGTESNFTSGEAPDTTSMVHWAVIMDRTSHKMELYKAGVKLGEAPANFGTQLFYLFSIGNYANPAGSSRCLIGRIDAVCISDEILAPASFVLPTTTSDVRDWPLHK
jgi:hypothetical protein